MDYLEERKFICKIAKSLFDRKLTDAAGGNISIKVSEDHFLMTPTLASVQYLWELEAAQILLVDKKLSLIEGTGRLTREINMHMSFYHSDPRIKAVIHAHPLNLMVYSCIGTDMPIVCENLRLGPDAIRCLDYAPATTEKLANFVGDYSQNMATNKERLPYGMLLREHGVIVGATNLAFANDYLERLETNAYVHLHSQALLQQGYEYYTDKTNVTYESHE